MCKGMASKGRILIRLECAACGVVQIAPTKMHIHNVSEGAAFYMFRCPKCATSQTGYTRAEFVDALVRSGAKKHAIPAEVLEERTGDPVSYDELLDFHFQLQSSDVAFPDESA